MYKLVIFDLDGTLVNSLADLGNACNEALAKFGFPTYDIEKYRYFVGDGVPMLIKRAVPADKGTDVIYRRTYNRLTRPYDGIVKLVADLKAKGILTAVASNKPDEFTQVIVSDMFEAGTFSYVSGKKDGFEKKPDPGIALHIMEKLDVSPEDTLFAGDSSVDMKTATNAGCDSIGCLWGFRTREELEENHAVYIAETPADIYNAAVNGK